MTDDPNAPDDSEYPEPTATVPGDAGLPEEPVEVRNDPVGDDAPPPADD